MDALDTEHASVDSNFDMDANIRSDSGGPLGNWADRAQFFTFVKSA